MFYRLFPTLPPGRGAPLRRPPSARLVQAARSRGLPNKGMYRFAKRALGLGHLDDVYILTRPEWARAAYDVAAEVLDRVCGIQVNQGKLVCWNRSRAPGE